MRLPALVLSAVLALPLTGDDVLVFEPSDPTSTTPVTAVVSEHDTCPPEPALLRTTSTITIVLGDGPCLSPPTLIVHRVELGVLAQGDYTITVRDGGQVVASEILTVLDANDLVRVEPAVGPVDGSRQVVVHADVNHCGNASCPPPEITFDHIPAANISVIGYGRFLVTPPPHAAGAVEVRVRYGDAEVYSWAFRYFDPAEPPMAGVFERVLVPVFYNGPGDRGSEWVTELMVRNSNPHEVPLWRPVGALPAVPPSRPVELDLGFAPGGRFLIVPRADAPLLDFGARVRELSKKLTGWGVELPIVREREFSPDGVDLLDVPLDPGYRLALRIYGLTPYPAAQAYIALYSIPDGTPLTTERVVPLTGVPGCVSFPCNSDRPAFGSVTDLAGLMTVRPASGRFGVRVMSHQPVWAFVSVTDNETQQVTVISPQ